MELEPNSTPPTEPVAQEPTSVDMPTDDFSFDADLSTSPAGETEPPAPAVPAGGAPPSVTPGAEGPAPASGTPPGAVAPTPPVAAAQPAAPAAPAVTPPQPAVEPPQAPGGAPADLLKMREALVSEIAQRYAMPEDVKEKFMLEPETVLPTMAARLYVDIYDAVLQTVLAQVPQIVTQREQVSRQARELQDKFYQRWPALKDPSYNEKIQATARAFRQANPKATPDEALEAVGAMVHVLMGVPIPGASQPMQPPPAKPPVPIAPGGAARGPAPAPTVQSLWDEMTSIE